MNQGKVAAKHFARTPTTVSTLTTVPTPASAGAVTITTVGVTFTVSASSVALKAGDWVFSATQLSGVGQVRKVVEVLSATTGILNEAFAADITGGSFSIVDGELLSRVWAIDLLVTGTTSLIDGVSYLLGTTNRISMPFTAEMTIPAQIQPVIIDGTSSKTCVATINFFKG